MGKNQIIQELRGQIETLKNAGPSKDFAGSVLSNSLTSLVGSAALQSNLASVTDIIQNNVYYPISLNYTMLMYMYKSHGVVQTVIDQPVLDAFRGGLEYSSKELDPTDIEEFENWMEEKGVIGTYCDARTWARLFGGGALIINAKSDFSRPLQLSTVKADGLEFYDACRWELMAPNMVSDKYGFYGKTLDASRVITMSGKRAPYVIRNQLSGWGMSELERIVADFNLHLRTENVLYEILSEAKLDVYSLDGYRDALATNGGTELVQRAIAMTNQMKNFHNALILDKEDNYTQKQLSFSGLAEIKRENRIGLSSACRMPMTKLFGMSSTGFNSGEDDIENYNSMVESEIREPSKPSLRKVINMCARAFFGDDYSLKFKFKPMRTMTSTEEESIKASQQSRAESLYNLSLLSSKEVGDICHKENLIPIDTAMARGELEDHPTTGIEGDGPGQKSGITGEDKDGGDGKAAGPWHRSPRGRMRRKLRSGRFEYRDETGKAPTK